MAYILVFLGIILLAYLFVVVRQWLATRELTLDEPRKPIVPVNLIDNENAILVSEGRGRVVYVNDHARHWFGMNGDEPNLTHLARQVQPPDPFRDIFASEGRAALRVGGRRVEAASYHIPAEGERRMVVVLRELTGEYQAEAEGTPNQAVHLMGDINLLIAHAQELDQTLEEILQRIGTAIPYDAAEINAWQESRSTLRNLSRVGDIEAPTSHKRATGTSPLIEESLSGWMARYREPLLVQDTRTRSDILANPDTYPFNSFLGVPLLVGERFIGTLELANRQREAFNFDDLALLQAISGQIAVALENLRLQRDQAGRQAELGGLQQIARATAYINEPIALFEQLGISVAKLMSVDICGVMLLNDDETLLRGQPPLFGVQDTMLPYFQLPYESGDLAYSLLKSGEGWYTNDALDNDQIGQLGLATLVELTRIHALAIVPMEVGSRRLGAVLVANPSDGTGFREDDLQSLRLFASEAGLVVENARLYRQSHRQSDEIEGIKQLGRHINLLHDPQELAQQISAGVAGLMRAEISGLWLYDEQAESLIPALPFVGGAPVSESGKVRLKPVASPPIKAIWEGAATAFANKPNPELGTNTALATFSASLGVTKTLFGALRIGDRYIGVVQVANRLDARDFDDSDAALLRTLAHQAALLIDNANLYAETYRRAYEADQLRELAERLANVINLEAEWPDIFGRITGLFNAEVLSIGLLDMQQGKLVYSPHHIYGRDVSEPILLDIFHPGFSHSVPLSRRSFLSNDVLNDERLLAPYVQIAEQQNFNQSIMVPLVMQNRSIGEMGIYNRNDGEPFTLHDMELLQAVAAQISAAMERQTLYQSTDADLRARVEKLDAIDRMSQALSESLEIDHILEVARAEVARGMTVDMVSLALLALRTDWIEVTSPLLEKRLGGTREMRSRLAPVEFKALTGERSFFVPDYKGSDLTPVPPDARSALVELLRVDGDIVGFIHIYSDQPLAFTDAQRDFVTQVAQMTGLAIRNAQRYRDQVRQNELLRVQANQLSNVISLGEMVRREVALEDILKEVAKALRDNLAFRKVLIRLVDESGELLIPFSHVGLLANEFAELKRTQRRVDSVRQLLQPRWKLGNDVYFMPTEHEEEWYTAESKAALLEMEGDLSRAWQDADILITPLRGSDGTLLGIISVDSPTNGRRPTLEVAESLQIFAAEAAFSIENYRFLTGIREEANLIRAERDRLASLHITAGEIQRTSDLPSRLNAVIEGIAAAGWQKVRLTLRNENLEQEMLVHTGYTESEVMRLRATILSGRFWQERLADPEFQALKIGDSAYYLRYDAPWVQEHVLRGSAQPESVDPDKWHPQDIVYLPLHGQNENRIIGIIGMEQPTDGLRPTEATLQPIELFATQAAASIESTQLYLETVLQKETEQRLTEMMQSVSATLDMGSVMRTLAEGLQQMIAFTRMHVALPDPTHDEFTLSRVEVTADQQVHLFEDEPVSMTNSAMAQVYREDKPLTVRLTDAKSAKKWPDLTRWYQQGERITTMVPMIAGGKTVGVLRLGSELLDAFGFEEHADLIQRMANLSAVTINHSRLLDDLTASTTYNEAVVESIQQGIVVLDEHHHITSINTFLRQRYGWTDDALGKSLYEQEPEFEVFLKHSISSALAEGQPQHQFEIQDIDADGNRMIRNFYTYPMLLNAKTIGIVLLIEDVTERAILESNLALRAEQLSALTRVSSRITSTLDPDQVVSVVLEALESVMPYDGVTLWLREGESLLRVLAARGYRDPGAGSADALIGLQTEIESSALFQEMSSDQKIINVGDTGGDDPRFPYGDERVYRNWLGAPLIYQAEVIGVIALEKREANFYNKDHEQLLQNFANQASVALSNARLFNQTTERAAALDAQTHRLELLNRVAGRLAQSLDIEAIFETTLRETALALEIEEALALKIDHEYEVARVVVEFPRGDQEPSMQFSVANSELFHRLRESITPLVVDSRANDPLYAEVKKWFRRDDIHSSLFVPLGVGGTLIGLMHFDAFQPDFQFTQERIEIAQTLASQAAIAVQNASLFEQSVMRTHELETLFEASQATAVTLDLDEAMRRVVSQMMSALRADYCSSALWDDIENRLQIRESISAWGEHDPDEPPGYTYDLADYPIREQALRHREVITIRSETDIHPSERASLEAKGIKDRLLVPLVVNDLSIGLILLEIREQSRFFESGDIRLARTLASQSAVAIENARLQTETRAQIEELYIINDLSRAASSKVKVDDLFPMVRDQLPVLTDADILYVGLYDDAQAQLSFPVAEHSADGPITMQTQALSEDEFSFVIRHKAPLLLAGMKMAEARDSYGIKTLLPQAACFLGVPMMAGEEVVGVLAVQDNDNPRAFGLNDQRILTTVASQLGVAIQNARLFAKTVDLASGLERRVQERTSELEQERQRVQTLYDITAEAAASLDISRVLLKALERVAEAIGATSGVILGIDEVSEQVYVLHSYGSIPVPPPEGSTRRQLQQDKGLAGWIMKHRQGVVIPDVQKDDRWIVRGDRDAHQRSAVASLIEVGEDSRGLMMLFSEEVEAFNEDHLKLVSAAASQLANSMNNAELYSLIRDQAERLGQMLGHEQRESTKNTAIVDAIADGVMYANEHGTIILFNTAAERILGLPAERVVNRSITEMTGLYGGSSGMWMSAMESWMNDPAAHLSENYVEELLELEDGRVVSVRLSPVSMGDQFLGTVSVFRDITKMVEVDRMKSEFVSTVSHELRTPMTSIKGYADLLLLGAAGEITEAQQRFLETIKQNADRLSILVNDLLEVSRIDQDRIPMRFVAVAIPDLLQGIEAHLIGRIEEGTRQLTVTIDAENVPPIRADYDRIIQIMQNLADNAYNYTPAGGQIILGATHQDGEKTVTLYVKDTGVGIPEAIQARVFERFFRGDEYADLVMDTPGTGLGLAIVKSLVEMHDGKIWFESQEGNGTTFYVNMPVADEQTIKEG